ncbi:FAD-binding protein [Gordonia sp. (in: high G+C Gram-positive bacteria)]|uniref:diflavin oxidoreductase n=1 Tax=Gordonia sp. (in: high G+C Gram-positive bacteria) TaxID=84139 RepID=UPI00168E9EA2|nr:FAD-binding protein [Gordonia sp. (in: high G+C Gram-positive bacteria)]NLG45564.1 FAD-binding protein [Gordonia sp. (in: high G+C Gram-positive bacteria)]
MTPANSTLERSSARASKRPRWSRRNPYSAVVVRNELLTAPESEKEVRHLVLDIEGSGLEYQPGDAVNVTPANEPALVAAIVERLGVPGETLIADRKGERTLTNALTHGFEITSTSPYLLDHLANARGITEVADLLVGDRAAIEAWSRGRDVLDLLNLDPTWSPTPEAFLAELRPLAARTYSISSSPSVHEGTLHLTPATLRHPATDAWGDGRDRGGAASTYLADRVDEGDTVGIYVTANKSFHLPEPDTDIIMIGPGTGIAPFRAFLHERSNDDGNGRNWLFHGARHRDQDFLYREEMWAMEADGNLRLDVAFSREQEEKVYVSHLMGGEGEELYSWIRDGAILYVCGDATSMARDVEETLTAIIRDYGDFDDDGARAEVERLREAGQYRRDVY